MLNFIMKKILVGPDCNNAQHRKRGYGKEIFNTGGEAQDGKNHRQDTKNKRESFRLTAG